MFRRHPLKIIISIVSAAIIMSGCGWATDLSLGRELTRQEVIDACKECEKAGLQSAVARDGMIFAIRRVECLPVVKP